MTLPKIMVAPNGARKTKEDHPGVPFTIAETMETAKACFEGGADGIHAHLRDDNQKHILDAGLYRELITELQIQVPKMHVQITTEAVGIYTAVQQRQLIRQVIPSSVSIGLAEIFSDGAEVENKALFEFAYENQMAIQFILYDPKEIYVLADYLGKDILKDEDLKLLYVLGRYTKGQVSSPDDLDGFIDASNELSLDADWAVCAFGKHETDCLLKAHKLGGKLRVGFENNVFNQDGSLAKSNEERVREIVRLTRP